MTLLRIALLCLLITPGLAQQYRVAGSVPLGGSGAWDYLYADSSARRLYVSHTAEVSVFDMDSGKLVGKLTGFGFVHGILVLNPDLAVLSDGGKADLVVFNPKTLTVLQKIRTAANPNSLAFDTRTQRLFVGHKPTKSMTVFDVPSFRVAGSVALGALPEFPVADGHGAIFLNIDDLSEIQKIDAHTLQVTAHWPLAPCKSPSGLAYAASTARLFAACDNKLMAVVDAATGKVVATTPIGEGPDAAAYDAGRKLVFTSNDDGTVTVIADQGADQFAVVQTLTTEKGARTLALDPAHHILYTATGILGPPPVASADNPNPTHHPTSVGDSFHLIVIQPAP